MKRAVMTQAWAQAMVLRILLAQAQQKKLFSKNYFTVFCFLIDENTNKI